MSIGRLLWLFAALVAACEARAELTPPRGPVDPRVRVVQYAPDQVYRIIGYVGYALHIELEDGEVYRGLGAGDSEALTIDVRGSDIFVKPRAILVETNLTLLTNRRRYHFDYTAHASRPNPSADEVIYSLRFLYPPTSLTEAGQVRTALSTDRSRPRNFDYWYCGHPALRPIAASDDGVHTRIRFSLKGETPAIFVKNEDGTESLLNFSIDSSTTEIVVHRVAPKFVLRRGRIVGCVVNRSYSGSGEMLPSGTVAPSVNRRTRGQ